ncbi:CpsD/CapB family tyrosine-protein kinase [Haliea sp. E17]|uniref:CpsD/CapB family tyrosine-protein kinase n=1 Tax=Haliea sp. E17 TaxID=3401576 RepID=UPI003AAD2A03
MEYVKDAIDKARKERRAEAKSARAGYRAGINPSGTKDDSPELRRGETCTRVEAPDKDTLLKSRIVAAFEHDERAEPYRQLRTQILKKFREQGWRTLAITSAHADAGKSLTALNTAIALSRDVNQTVLLVDLDFKGPDLLGMLGLSTGAGLVEYLQDAVELQDILVNPGMERLTILPANPVSGATSEILSSPQMKRALDEIVYRYDDRIIVFDLPPLLRDDDALVFVPYVDTTLLVVESGVTTPEEMERCIQLLEGVDILGTILNKSY